MEDYIATNKELAEQSELEPLRVRITQLESELHELNVRAGDISYPYHHRLDKLEDHIKTQVLEIGATISHNGVTAKFKKGYTSETYPVTDVRKILLANPAILPAFNAISNVKEYEPTVRVSYKPEVEEDE